MVGILKLDHLVNQIRYVLLGRWAGTQLEVYLFLEIAVLLLEISYDNLVLSVDLGLVVLLASSEMVIEFSQKIIGVLVQIDNVFGRLSL